MCSENFDSLANFRSTKSMGIVPFIISIALRILFTFFVFSDFCLFSFTHHDKTTNKKIKLRPLLTVQDDDFHDVMADPNIGSGKHCVVPKTKVYKLPQQLTTSASRLPPLVTSRKSSEEIEKAVTHL